MKKSFMVSLKPLSLFYWQRDINSSHQIFGHFSKEMLNNMHKIKPSLFFYGLTIAFSILQSRIKNPLDGKLS